MKFIRFLTYFYSLLTTTWAVGIWINLNCKCIDTSTTHSIYKSIIKNEKIKKNFINNHFSAEQILYWHDNSPSPKITNVNRKNVNFSLSTKEIFWPYDLNEIKNNLWLNNIQQEQKDTKQNSGSYMWGDNGYDSNKRLVEWDKPIKDYLYLTKNNQTAWTNDISNINFETNLIWQKKQSIKQLKAIKVWQNGDDTSYKYGVNEKISFIRGINKELNNENYDIVALPYVYVKETQYVYVVYNYVSRFVYTLQPIVNNLANKFVNTYNCQQLVTINNIDYNQHTLSFGFNPELLQINNEYNTLINSAIYQNAKNNSFDYEIEEYFNRYVDTGQIDGNNIEYLTNVKNKKELDEKIRLHNPKINLLLEKFCISSLNQFAHILTQIINEEMINLTINYSTWNDNNKTYCDYNQQFTTNDLLNHLAKIKIFANNQNKYAFKINSININENNSEYYYLPEYTYNFNYKFSSSHIIPYENGYMTIDEPIIDHVEFLDVPKTLLNNFPSYLTLNDIVNNFVYVYDDQNMRLNSNVIGKDQIELIDNDLLGNLIIKINSNVRIYTGFRKINLSQFNDIPVTTYQYGLNINELDNEIIDCIIDNYFGNNISIKFSYKVNEIDEQKGYIKLQIIKVNDENYSPLLNKNIVIKDFEPIYIKKINTNYLLGKNLNKITIDNFKTNLIELSPAFKKFYEDQMKITLEVLNKKTLNAKISYPYHEIILQYVVNDEKQIINIILAIVLGISALIFCICMYKYIKKKKISNVC